MPKNIKKKTAIFILVLLVLGLLPLLTGVNYLSRFSKASGLSSGAIFRQTLAGTKNQYDNQYLTILLLGLDQREGQDTLLTDTILLTVINTQTGDYLMFSLPRDLWISDLQTKINALYYYGRQEQPDNPSWLVKQRIETLLDWPINQVVVLKMDDIKNLVDSLGGVKTVVENSFVDEEFPKDDGSFETMTVSFSSGDQIFDGQQALNFMRSRKSITTEESGDQARQRRQKQIILAVKNTLMSSKKDLLNPEKLGLIYRFASQLESAPALDLGKVASWLSFLPKILKGQESESELSWTGDAPLLVNQRDPIYNSWILLPQNGWQSLTDFFHQRLP
ncbi:MAG: LCP family protein [Patescibacteria group bacterium]